jgi:hypothetical protein
MLLNHVSCGRIHKSQMKLISKEIQRHYFYLFIKYLKYKNTNNFNQRFLDLLGKVFLNIFLVFFFQSILLAK